MDRQAPAAVAAAKRCVVHGGNLPVAEGLRIEAEEWLKAGIEPKALELMQSYVDTPYKGRHVGPGSRNTACGPTRTWPPARGPNRR